MNLSLKSIAKNLMLEVTSQIKNKALTIGGDILGTTVFIIALLVVAILVFFLGNITLAFFLSTVLGAYWKGFGAVAALYLLLVLILLMMKKSIKRSVANAVTKSNTP